MELMLEIISRQKFSPDIKPTCVFSEVGGYIGRSAESDWVLPDRAKRLSRKHILISCDGRDFYLEDLSSNGVLCVLTKELVGKNGKRKIRHSDSFQIGEYVVQARLLMNPEVYNTPREMDASSGIIPDEAFLDLDPLTALDQEDETRAKQRLGFYDSLLGNSAAPGAPMRDHGEARRDAMGPVKARPENSDPALAALNKSIDESIEELTKTIAGLTETVKSLKAARASMGTFSKKPSAALALETPIIPEDFNPNDLF